MNGGGGGPNRTFQQQAAKLQTATASTMSTSGFCMDFFFNIFFFGIFRKKYLKNSKILKKNFKEILKILI
jgi:hypothetical protein